MRDEASTHIKHTARREGGGRAADTRKRHTRRSTQESAKKQKEGRR